MIDFTSIDSVLQQKGVCFSKTKGVSMRPFIVEGRDTVQFQLPNGQLKKYDMALYKRKDGKYCMHRVLKVLDDCYFIMGDNLTDKEYVKKTDIIAVATGYFKGKKFIDCNTNRCYRFKVRLWCSCIPLRSLFIKVKRKLSKIFCK